MTREDFKKLRNFGYQEMLDHFKSKGFSTWGAKLQVARMKFSFMKKLQRFRSLIGRPVFYNCLTEGKHAKNSSHYRAEAADIRIGGKGKINWNNMLQCAVEAGMKGIGYYPNWNTPGLHLDDRKGVFKCWKRIKVGGKKVYRGLI